jgi:hypothetical protein
MTHWRSGLFYRRYNLAISDLYSLMDPQRTAKHGTKFKRTSIV